MKGFLKFLSGIKGKTFNKRHFPPSGGIPYVLGQGLNSPYVEPGLSVYWHPPFSIMEADRPVVRKTGVRSLFTRLGFRKRPA